MDEKQQQVSEIIPLARQAYVKAIEAYFCGSDPVKLSACLDYLNKNLDNLVMEIGERLGA